MFNFEFLVPNSAFLTIVRIGKSKHIIKIKIVKIISCSNKDFVLVTFAKYKLLIHTYVSA